MKLRLLLLGALIVAGVVIWAALSEDAPVKVDVVAAEVGTIVASVANTRAGTVDACRRAGLSPSTGGQIASLPVTEGDRVEQGQLLVELWNEDLKAQLALAQRGQRAEESRARQACVIADVAKRESERLTKLRGQGLASVEATERAEGEAQSQAAACRAARDSALVGAAQVDAAEASLERTRLRAPFEGVIAEINGELGEFVTPSPVGVATPPTVDLVDSSCLYISAPIDEVDAPAVRAGMSARVSLDAFSERVFSAHVRRVAPYVLDQEKQARTVEIEVEIDDPDKGDLLPGYSADVEVILQQKEDVVRVPTAAIVDNAHVFILNEAEGTLERRDVEIGLTNWQMSEITAGIRAGDWVVTSIDREGVEDGAAAEK